MAKNLINLSTGKVVKTEATTRDLTDGLALMDTVRHFYDAEARAIKPRPLNDQISILIERSAAQEERIAALESQQIRKS